MTFKADELNGYFGGKDLYKNLDTDNLISALSAAVKCPTVSDVLQKNIAPKPFLDLHAVLEKYFPLVHSAMKKEVINDYSLLYTWQGSDKSLKPVLFMAHLDVVPVMPGTESDWTMPSYGGDVHDGFVWGRGACDCKSLLVCELAAAEHLLAQGYTPERTIYFGFGHDEEVMGGNGATKISEHLENGGVTLEFLLDEGGGFMWGKNFGAPDKLLAKVDIFEKGYADILLKVTSPGGHSSRPGKGTALGKMAKAIVALEQNPCSPKMNPVVESMCKELAQITEDSHLKTIFSDPAAHSADVLDFLMQSDRLAPLVHTTTAATMISGSPAPNVLPQTVEAVINFRITAGETTADVIEHCKNVIDDPQVEVILMNGQEPSGIADISGRGYEIIKNAAEEFFPAACFLPGLVTGGTDACFYENICSSCLRFRPNIDSLALSATTHATDERVSCDSLVQAAKTVTYIMERAGKAE